MKRSLVATLAIALAVAGAVTTLGIKSASAVTFSYRIVNYHSGHCLDIQNSSLGAGKPAVQNNCGVPGSQFWYFVKGDVGYALKNYNSNLCLGITGSSQASGAAVIQGRCSVLKTDHSQEWNLG